MLIEINFYPAGGGADIVTILTRPEHLHEVRRFIESVGGKVLHERELDIEVDEVKQ